MNIAIIPARIGSKRIPRKNIKEFCGQPMIIYAINAAKSSKLFEHIIVSTDDDEIAKIAINEALKCLLLDHLSWLMTILRPIK